ncbi:MAG: hypothetical protein EBS55_12750, partial [Flavobacteriaceae bacterium]|nr:hypothetical protein [Flavobacteriaceae bacterium]
MQKFLTWLLDFSEWKSKPQTDKGIIWGLILFFTLLLFCNVTFSQVSSWRSNPPQPRVSTPSIQSQRSDLSSWRNESPREFNRPERTKPGSNIIVNNNPWLWNDWGWGWNRWNMWGAPAFGWNYWSPSFYWNDWGYRQPARIYVYGDGKRDTVKGKKPIISFGLHKTTDKQFGGFFTIGNRGYFIMDYTSTFEIDRSTYFPYGTLAQVDFPLINDLVKKRSLYLGAGKRFGRTGVHAMIGFGNERVFFRGRDRVGEITFPKSNTQFTSIKFGALRDFKNFTLKFDTDPIRSYSQFGIG